MSSFLLRGGRVVDPASGQDGVADLLVHDGRVAAIGMDLSAQNADTVVDVTGLIVGPGFIDLHSHVHSIAGHRLQALDGVTMALDLEAGLLPVDVGYRRAAEQGRPLHYGFSASWAAARGQVMTGADTDANIFRILTMLGDPQWQRPSRPQELEAVLALLANELAAGALGIGVLVGYAPSSDPAEFLAVAQLAAAAGVPTYTHVRELAEADPNTPIDGSAEIVRAAAETGARMHHCHVNSTSRRHIDRVLTTLAEARSAGSKVTVEAYPYGAGSSGVGAFFLAPERLSAWGLQPSDIVLLPSGERVADVNRLREIRTTEPGTLCIVDFLDEQDAADEALLWSSMIYPDAIVASDATPLLWPGGATDSRLWPLPAGAHTHPRTAGTFAKTIRRMVRETGTWTWPEVFRRCSLLPARLLDFVAAARNKGHLGADADIVVLDPDRICDAATYQDPTQPSVGVRHLFVAGTPVVCDGTIVPDAFPGRPLRASPR
ncbi:amidohydrolase family protein [Fodinicola feengrottensis]|uniref:Amidohydrolase family protein n=1 Tax=Fodinicola feengrottensis TaxID=435914 RepID=A0ABN2J7V7_9ACTN